jgi:hypothetical protein
MEIFSFCPECGPNVLVDEDGCCNGCGATATGRGVKFIEDMWRGLVLAKEGRPKVVCLCGSSRFYDAYQQAEYEETMKGHIYLSIGFYPHSTDQAHGEGVGCTSDEKKALDELHKRKIDLADEVFVLNVGGYIGDSTKSEVEYAKATGTPIRWLEPCQAS